MSFFTVFLIVLIIALFAGTALLSLALPKRQKKKFGLQGTAFAFPSVQEPTVLVESSSGNSLSDKVMLIDARVNALNNKILMAHDRLQRIEEMLLQLLSKPALPQPMQQSGAIDATVLTNRVERLIDFKSSTEIEIAAIKDALRKSNILPPLEKEKFEAEMRQKYRKASREISDLERKVHEVIYHAAKK